MSTLMSTDFAKVFGAFLGRPDGFGSSDFTQFVDLLMLYRFIWFPGADSRKNMDLLAEEWSNFDDFSG